MQENLIDDIPIFKGALVQVTEVGRNYNHFGDTDFVTHHACKLKDNDTFIVLAFNNIQAYGIVNNEAISMRIKSLKLIESFKIWF